MILNNKVSAKLFEELNETKQISKLSFEDKDFKNWCHTLNCIAALNYKRRQLGDDELSDYKVPSQLIDLVIPRKISMDIGDDFEDYRGNSYSDYLMNLELHGMSDAVILDSILFNRISKGILGSRKASPNTLTSVDSNNGEVTYASLCDRLMDLSRGYDVSGVLVSTSHYVPVDFKFNRMVVDFYTQNPVNTIVKWFSNALDNMSK